MRFFIAAITFIATIALSPSDEIFAGKSTSAPAGNPLKGFALSLAPNVSTVQLGSPIVVTVEVRNVSGNQRRASVAPRDDFLFRIVNTATKESVARNLMSTFGLDRLGGPNNGRPWGTGRAVFLPFRLDLLYNFKKPGTYAVNVSQAVLNINGEYTRMPPSNVVILRVR
jgi:hypothetical protein